MKALEVVLATQTRKEAKIPSNEWSLWLAIQLQSIAATRRSIALTVPRKGSVRCPKRAGTAGLRSCDVQLSCVFKRWVARLEEKIHVHAGS